MQLNRTKDIFKLSILVSINLLIFGENFPLLALSRIQSSASLYSGIKNACFDFGTLGHESLRMSSNFWNPTLETKNIVVIGRSWDFFWLDSPLISVGAVAARFVQFIPVCGFCGSSIFVVYVGGLYTTWVHKDFRFAGANQPRSPTNFPLKFALGSYD